MKGKNLLKGILLTGFVALPIYKTNAQTYDVPKTTQFVNEMQNKGYNLKGTFLNDPLEFQIDYNGTSTLINPPLAAEESDNNNLMIYPISAIFTERNSETISEKEALNNYGGLGFILDDNNISPQKYADSLSIILQGISTGIEETKKGLVSKLEISNLYPNPTNGMVNVQYSIKGSKPVIFNVYNVLGKKVYSFEGKLGENTKKIDVANLTSGIYFLRAESSEEIIQKTKKFSVLK